MECPLNLYSTGSLGTVDYYGPCGCMWLSTYTQPKYRKSGILVQFQSVGSTGTATVSVLGTADGAGMPLVAETTAAPVTNADITAGTAYRVYPVTLGGILRGIVEGL